MSAPAEICAVSAVMFRSSKVRWMAATRKASGIARSTAASTV